jgi:hypothetical protein
MRMRRFLFSAARVSRLSAATLLILLLLGNTLPALAATEGSAPTQGGAAPCAGDYGGIALPLAETITNGVPNPKNYRSGMPPMGGDAQLSPTDVLALADYVWALNQRKE